VPTIILAAAVVWTLGFPSKNVASRAVQSSREIPYTTDSFEGLRWRWHYASGEIIGLGSFCPACDFQVYPNNLSDGSGRVSFKCDHCDRDLGTHQGNYPYLESKVTRLIQRKLRAKNEDLDLLTHVFNRKRFGLDLVSFSAQADHAQPLSLITIDIDNFKPVNDRYGHATGDKILEQIPMVFRTLIEKRGECYRTGGDEFAVLLPNHSLAEAEALATRICTAVSACFKGRTGITVSAGVASIPETARESKQMFQDADAAMYTAKHDGGNRAHVCPRL
jgi:diguanylate cyclase (GGDEF)-like protein